MKKIYINEQNNGITFVNGTNTIQTIENKEIKPYQYVTFPSQFNSQINIRDQVSLPLGFPYPILCICYESNGQPVFMPLTVTNRVMKDEASFQAINLTKRPVSVQAKHGDHLGDLTYQGQLKSIQIAPKMDLHIDYYQNGKLLYSTIEQDVKGGINFCHIMTENKTHPLISLEIFGK